MEERTEGRGAGGEGREENGVEPGDILRPTTYALRPTPPVLTQEQMKVLEQEVLRQAKEKMLNSFLEVVDAHITAAKEKKGWAVELMYDFFMPRQKSNVVFNQIITHGDVMQEVWKKMAEEGETKPVEDGGREE